MHLYLLFIPIPIIGVGILYYFFKHKCAPWEYGTPFLIYFITVAIAKVICINNLTADTEYIGGYVEQVEYYEAWNERVSCRHPIYCTSCSGSGKNRSCHTYVCGHLHPYDVDYHPESWYANTTLGAYGISKEKYNKLLTQFKALPVFKDLNRRYHSIDGDMYYGRWHGEDETLEAVTQTETYENRPQAAASVFHWDKVDTTEVKQYKLFEYPSIYDLWKQKNILGYKDKVAEQSLQVLNARLGKSKQVRVYVLVFYEQPRMAGQYQEMYWAGANKNELVLCIGIDKYHHVTWAHDFTWSEATDLTVDLRTKAEEQIGKKLDLNTIITFAHGEVNSKWVRKNFHDFDYLTIEPTFHQTMWILVIVLITTIGCCWFAVANDIDSDD